MKIEKLCYIGLIVGVLGIIFSWLDSSDGGLSASAVVCGSSLIALAIAQRTKQE